jgi:sulfur carrier protein ThiS
MKIEVNLYATLSQYLPDGNKGPTHIVDVVEGTTVSELLRQLGVPTQSAKLIFLDGIHSDLDAVLKEGNRLGVFPPVGGGKREASRFYTSILTDFDHQKYRLVFPIQIP